MLLLLLGRGTDKAAPTTAPTTAPATTATTTAPSTPTAPVPVDPAELLRAPDAALLNAVRVKRDGKRYTVEALWGSSCTQGCRRYVYARSSDGFRSADYEVGRFNRMSRRYAEDGDGPRRIGTVPVDDGLLVSPVVSLRRGVTAAVAGGDGATLFPFEHAARRTDGGGWEVFDIARPGGEMPYLTGSVVLSDGRHLALVNDWSGDRRNRPSRQPHGLLVSDGDDWSSYAPLEPRFDPPVDPFVSSLQQRETLGASADPDPVIWVTTFDQRLYVSTDDAGTFTEIPAR